jgi:hypothetical protein
MALVRLWTGVSAFDRNALKIVIQSCVEASRVREDLADIINIAIEELIRKRYELPGFTTLFRAARTARATVNRSYYRRVSEALDVPTRTRIDSLFEKPEGGRQTPWERVKNEPGQPTIKGVRRFLENARWLKEQTIDCSAVPGIPAVKLQRFAAEARALNAARMKEAKPDKRYAFAVALIRRQRARALDDAGDMLIRLVQRMQNTAKEKLQLLQAAHLQRSASLVSKLRDVGLAYLSDGSEAQRLHWIGQLPEPFVLRSCAAVPGENKRSNESSDLAVGSVVRLGHSDRHRENAHEQLHAGVPDGLGLWRLQPVHTRRLCGNDGAPDERRRNERRRVSFLLLLGQCAGGG